MLGIQERADGPLPVRTYQCMACAASFPALSSLLVHQASHANESSAALAQLPSPIPAMQQLSCNSCNASFTTKCQHNCKSPHDSVHAFTLCRLNTLQEHKMSNQVEVEVHHPAEYGADIVNIGQSQVSESVSVYSPLPSVPEVTTGCITSKPASSVLEFSTSNSKGPALRLSKSNTALAVPELSTSTVGPTVPGLSASTTEPTVPGLSTSTTEPTVPGICASTAEPTVPGLSASTAEPSVPGLTASTAEPRVPGLSASTAGPRVFEPSASTSESIVPGFSASIAGPTVPGLSISKASKGPAPIISTSNTESIVPSLTVFHAEHKVPVPGLSTSNVETTVPLSELSLSKTGSTVPALEMNNTDLVPSASHTQLSEGFVFVSNHSVTVSPPLAFSEMHNQPSLPGVPAPVLSCDIPQVTQEESRPPMKNLRRMLVSSFMQNLPDVQMTFKDVRNSGLRSYSTGSSSYSMKKITPIGKTKIRIDAARSASAILKIINDTKNLAPKNSKNMVCMIRALLPVVLLETRQKIAGTVKGTKQGLFQCGRCRRVFYNLDSMILHHAVHKKTRITVCGKCQQIIIGKMSAPSYHICPGRPMVPNKVNENKRFTCYRCHRSYSRLHRLKIHPCIVSSNIVNSSGTRSMGVATESVRPVKLESCEEQSDCKELPLESAKSFSPFVAKVAQKSEGRWHGKWSQKGDNGQWTVPLDDSDGLSEVEDGGEGVVTEFPNLQKDVRISPIRIPLQDTQKVQPRVNCMQCGKSFSSKETLAQHIMKYHPVTKKFQEQQPKPHTPPKSPKPVGQDSAVEHPSSNGGETLGTDWDALLPVLPRKVSCECGASFTCPRLLLRHLQQHAQEDLSYICPDCGGCSQSWAAHESHLRTHNRLACARCHASFTTRKSLMRHVTLKRCPGDPRRQRPMKRVPARRPGPTPTHGSPTPIATSPAPVPVPATPRPALIRCSACQRCFSSVEGLQKHLIEHTHPGDLRSSVAPQTGASSPVNTHL